MTAPRSRKSVKLLVRLKVPESHVPFGTLSCAPPSAAKPSRCRTARRKASVFDVLPSPTPPKSVIDITIRFGDGSWLKNPEQVTGSYWEDGIQRGRKELEEIWRERMAKTVKTRRRNAHEGLVMAVNTVVGFFSDSIVFDRTEELKSPWRRRRSSDDYEQKNTEMKLLERKRICMCAQWLAWRWWWQQRWKIDRYLTSLKIRHSLLLFVYK